MSDSDSDEDGLSVDGREESRDSVPHFPTVGVTNLNAVLCPPICSTVV
jgi:hypothetical protein